MNTEYHATPPPLAPVVSEDESDDDSIGVPKVSEVEPLGYNGPPDSHIPP